MSDIKEDAPETVPAKKKGVSFSVRAKTITAVAIASLIVVLSSSFTGYVLRQDSLLEEFQILTKSIASTGAIGISGDDLKLIRSNQDVLEPEFQFARERLEAIRDANGLRSEEIYILRPINMEAFETEFVVMPGDEPFVGNVYNIRPENRQAFQTAFRDGKISGTNIYEDEHGTWISAYAPIFDLDGKVEAVLEVDAEISRFLERAQQEFLQVLAVGLGAFLFALIPGIYLVNRVTAGLRVIKSALDQFEGGDEKTNVQLNTRDELEDVARSFNEMTSKLAESRENLVSTNISLQNRTNELNQSLTLTNTIMSTVQESLMLITPEGKIEPGYSAAVETMFGRQDVTKMPFVDLVRDRVTGKTYDLTNRFLKLLFNESKTNHLIPKMNPLKEVEVMVEGKNGQMQTKYLSFSFDRVWEDKKVVQSLVTVEDITPRIALTRELKESAERLERQAELLFGIIHVEPRLLNEFIQTSRGELDSISSQLSKSIDAESDLSDRQAYFEEQVESIFRCVHRIKGEAALLKISYYEDAAHEFESKLEKLRGKRNLDGNDFVPIVLELSRMIQSFDDMSDVIEKITTMYGGTSPVTPAQKGIPATSDSPHLDTLAKDLALAHQKQVHFTIPEKSLEKLPEPYRKPSRDMLVQFIRNSIAHGIELPQERSRAGKPEAATLKLETHKEAGWLRLIYSDDGRGLDYEKVIARAEEIDQQEPGLLRSLLNQEQTEWDIDKLNNLVFRPGFSTSQRVDKDSGRGVGLDAVKQMVDDLKGHISLHTEQGEYCAFIVDLPLTPNGNGL